MTSMHSRPPRKRYSALATGAIAVLSLAALLSARTATESSPLATIQGFVRNQATQAPIANAWVCFAELLDKDNDGVHLAVHAFTDATGHYSLTMPSDEFEWIACSSAAGFANATATSVAVPANQDFLLHAAPGSLQFWGQLGGSPTGLLSGTQIYSDLDASNAVSVTDELGRFPLAVDQNVVVPLTIMSTTLGLHRYEIDINANVPISNPSPVLVAQAIPQTSVLTDVTILSYGGGAPAGTELAMVGVDASGDVVFQATETMDSAQFHTNQFDVPDGLSLYVCAANDLGWGTTQVSTPYAGPIPVSIDDLGTGSITARIVPHVGMPDPGKLTLEVFVGAPGVDFFVPLYEVSITPGTPTTWDQLPAGTYRLRHTSTRFDRLVDEIDLSPGEQEAHTYLAHMVREITPDLGTGTGNLMGSIGVPQPANTAISIYLTDMVDGRVAAQVTADSAGNFSFSQVPAGDWFLHADGVHDNGMEYRLLTGTMRVSISTGQTLSLPTIELTPSIGLAFRAYAYDFVPDSGSDIPILLPLDTYSVSLLDQQGLVLTQEAGGFHLLAIGSVPTGVTKAVVDGLHLGSKTVTIDLTGVDPLDHFQVYDIVVN